MIDPFYNLSVLRDKLSVLCGKTMITTKDTKETQRNTNGKTG